jgi:HEAT repeat protein
VALNESGTVGNSELEDSVLRPVNIGKLLENIRRGEPKVRASATDALRDLGPAAKEAVPALLEMLLEEKDKEVRECAASVLMYIGAGAAPVRPQLLRIFKDPHEDRDIREMVAGAIAEMGTDSLPTLCQCLKDPDPFVRTEAADGFYRMGPTALGSVSALIEALEDEDSDVRGCAKSALEEMGEGALPALRESLSRLTDRTRLQVCALILKIEPSDQDSLAILATGLRHADFAMRREAVNISHSLVDQSFDQMFRDIEPSPYPKNPHWKVLVSPLLHTLNDSDSEVRFWSAAALGELRSNPAQVVRALMKALQDHDKEVRVSVVRALANFQERAAPALHDLIQALEKDTYDVQLAVIDALGQIGRQARVAAPLLQKAARSSDTEMRTRAKDALRGIKRK